MFVRNDNSRSPMGMNAMAFDSKKMGNKFITDNGGEQMSWMNVVDLVRKRSE